MDFDTLADLQGQQVYRSPWASEVLKVISHYMAKLLGDYKVESLYDMFYNHALPFSWNAAKGGYIKTVTCYEKHPQCFSLISRNVTGKYTERLRGVTSCHQRDIGQNEFLLVGQNLLQPQACSLTDAAGRHEGWRRCPRAAVWPNRPTAKSMEMASFPRDEVGLFY